MVRAFGFSTTGSRYQNITGLAVDANDNLYVADTQYGNYRIRRHGPASVGVSNINDLATISQPEQTVLQSGSPGNADGIQATARFSAAPAGIAVDRAGHVFVADRDNQRIRKVYFVPGDIPPVPPPVVVSVSANDASQLGEELLPAFNADPAAVLLLGALRASWDTGLYGPRPADGVLIDFAWERCKADPDECNTLADARWTRSFCSRAPTELTSRPWPRGKRCGAAQGGGATAWWATWSAPGRSRRAASTARPRRVCP